MIRTCDEKDIATVSILEEKIFPTSFYSRQELENMFLNDNYYIYISENAKEVDGYLILHDSIDILEIMKIAVVPSKWGKGIAQEIIERILQEFPQNLLLEVRESNLRAQKFYEKMNFKRIGIRKRYYSDNGENAILMMLEK